MSDSTKIFGALALIGLLLPFAISIDEVNSLEIKGLKESGEYAYLLEDIDPERLSVGNHFLLMNCIRKVICDDPR